MIQKNVEDEEDQIIFYERPYTFVGILSVIISNQLLEKGITELSLNLNDMKPLKGQTFTLSVSKKDPLQIFIRLVPDVEVN